jgi:hypothetical protein
VFSSLYVVNRNKDGGPLQSADVNAGEPLNKHFPGARNFLVLPDMTQSEYGSFCRQLDSNLHGNVHVSPATDQIWDASRRPLATPCSGYTTAISIGSGPDGTRQVGAIRLKLMVSAGPIRDSCSQTEAVIGSSSQLAPSLISRLSRIATTHCRSRLWIMDSVNIAASSPSEDRVLLRPTAPDIAPADAGSASAVPLGGSVSDGEVGTDSPTK